MVLKKQYILVSELDEHREIDDMNRSISLQHTEFVYWASLKF